MGCCCCKRLLTNEFFGLENCCFCTSSPESCRNCMGNLSFLNFNATNFHILQFFQFLMIETTKVLISKAFVFWRASARDNFFVFQTVCSQKYLNIRMVAVTFQGSPRFLAKVREKNLLLFRTTSCFLS